VLLEESSMDFISILETKRDGGTLEPEQIDFIVRRYTEGRIPDEQMATFLMAVYLQGMDAAETVALTRSMIESGKTVRFGNLPATPVDKHSTGGVGDKITIPLVPLVAACAVPVPMLSGRSLQHSGGTLDKLESIPGYRTDLSLDEFRKGVETVGAVIMGQTEELAPADRKIYALRDVTATVPSMPLITASILSKKVVGGAKGLVLDVKCGVGAFMIALDKARALAESLKETGMGLGLEVSGFITRMDQPIGRCVGNALEILESIEVLRGEGPEDTTDLTVLLGSEMLRLGGVVSSREEGERQIRQAIESGRGLEKFREIIENQGGNPRVVDDPDILPKAENIHEFTAPGDGCIEQWDARLVGLASMELGAGRIRKEDRPDLAVGIEILKKTGDTIDKGEPVARIHWNNRTALESSLSLLNDAFSLGDAPRSPSALVIESV